jgi:uncharacterized protein (TIGR02001 family)
MKVAYLLIPGLMLMATASHAADAPPFKLTGEASVASVGITKGASDTNGDPQGLIGLKVSHGIWFAGARIKNVKTENGDDQQEWYAGAAGKAGGYDLSLQLVYKKIDGAPAGTDDAYYEWQGAIGRSFGATALKLSEQYTGDSAGKTKASYWTEASVTQKITPKFSVSAAYGHRDVTPAKNYNGWNIGGTYALLKTTSLDLRWYDTDEHAYGDKYKSFLVAKLSQKF